MFLKEGKLTHQTFPKTRQTECLARVLVASTAFRVYTFARLENADLSWHSDLAACGVCCRPTCDLVHSVDHLLRAPEWGGRRSSSRAAPAGAGRAFRASPFVAVAISTDGTCHFRFYEPLNSFPEIRLTFASAQQRGAASPGLLPPRLLPSPFATRDGCARVTK